MDTFLYAERHLPLSPMEILTLVVRILLMLILLMPSGFVYTPEGWAFVSALMTTGYMMWLVCLTCVICVVHLVVLWRNCGKYRSLWA